MADEIKAPAEPITMVHGATLAPPRVNAGHVSASAGVTSMLGMILMWGTHWPLQPMDENTAGAAAGLIVCAGIGLRMLWTSRTPKNLPVLNVAPVIPTKTGDAP